MRVIALAIIVAFVVFCVRPHTAKPATCSDSGLVYSSHPIFQSKYVDIDWPSLKLRGC